MRTTTLYTKIDALTDANARIARIAQQLCGRRSKWEQGVCDYIDELLDEQDGRALLKVEDIQTATLNGVDSILLNGADDWNHYSRSGCSLCYNDQICARLATESEQKRTRNGSRMPNPREDWIDCQARALWQAAYWIKQAVREVRMQVALEVEREWRALAATVA